MKNKPDPTDTTYQRIYAVVRKIPRGKVATYGQVAALAGLPGHARQAGYALHSLPEDLAEEIPWQRVINAQGEISRRAEPAWEEIQRGLLEAEGVVFSVSGKVDLKRYRWKP